MDQKTFSDFTRTALVHQRGDEKFFFVKDDTGVGIYSSTHAWIIRPLDSWDYVITIEPLRPKLSDENQNTDILWKIIFGFSGRSPNAKRQIKIYSSNRKKYPLGFLDVSDKIICLTPDLLIDGNTIFLLNEECMCVAQSTFFGASQYKRVELTEDKGCVVLTYNEDKVGLSSVVVNLNEWTIEQITS